MLDTDFRDELLKLASDIRSMASEIQEQEKVAAESQDFSLGAVGGVKKSTDPLMDFIFS